MAYLIKICMLGDGGVGKTALTMQMLHNHFVDTYDPTIEDSYRTQMRVDGEACVYVVYLSIILVILPAGDRLEILDTAGQEDFTVLWEQWIRDSDAFVLVYDTTSRRSFDQTSMSANVLRRNNANDIPALFKKKISNVRGSEPVLVLVGNKCDLVTKRLVSTEEGRDLATTYGCMFEETSGNALPLGALSSPIYLSILSQNEA